MIDRPVLSSIGDIAEAFVAELRRGNGVSVEAYAAKYPEHADEIRDLFPAMAMLERLKRAPGASAISTAGHGMNARVSPGVRLGDYRLLREIGRGGMGLVFEAEQESLARRVAVKILPERLACSPASLERFRREARAVARLHHTNIVPVFGVGESDGVHFYVMQYIAGEGLDAVLRQVRRLRDKDESHALDENASRIAESLIVERCTLDLPSDDSRQSPGYSSASFATKLDASNGAPTGPPPQPGIVESTRPDSGHSGITESSRSTYYRRVAQIALQVADALAYAHAQGVLHRDIKPANLLLDLQGTVWLTDFGLAKESESGELTGTGDLVGTLRFMPPERLAGKSLAEGDIYGLGLTLYEMLTLRPAYRESDVGQLASRLANSTPFAPRQIEPTIPKDLETIVLKCTARAPEDRYRRADQLAEDLRRFLSDRPILARRFGPAERSWRWCRRNPLVAGLSAALLVVLASLAVFGNLSARQFRGKHDEAVKNLQRAVTAEADLRRNNATLRSTLAGSLVAQAHALRVSGEQGCQFRALELLDQAAAIERLPSLRNEVIAALTRFDARPRRALKTPEFWNIGAAAFDHDLRRMAVLDRDRVLKVIATQDGRELFRTEVFRNGPPHGIRDGLSLAFLRDGKSVVFGRTVTPDHDELWIWDLRQGTAPRRLVRDAIILPPVVMSDDATLAVVRREGGIQLLDTATGKEKRRWAAGRRVRWPAFSPDGKQITFGLHDDPHLVIWNAETDREVARFTLPDKVYGVAWNSDGKLIAAGCGDHQAYVFDAQLKRRHSVLPGHRMQPMYVAFAQPGDWLVSWDADFNLIVSDPISGKPVLTARGGVHGIRADGRRWIVLDADGFSEWEVATPSAYNIVRHRFILDPQTNAWMEGPRSVDVSSDGRLLATSDLDGLRLYSMSAPPRELAWLPVRGSHAAFFDCFGNLYSSSTALGLRRWSIRIDDQDKGGVTLRVGQPERFGPAVRDERPPFFFDSQRHFLFLGDNRARQNRLLMMPDGAEASPILQRRASMLAAVDREGRWAVTSDMYNDETTVWNARDGAVIHSWPKHGWGRFTPCGRWLLLRFAGENEFRLFRSGDWTQERAFPCRDSSFSVPSFSPEGRMIALCEYRAIRLLDFESFEPLAELPTGPGNLEYVGCVFSPDGSQLVAARRGHIANVWDLRAIRLELKRRDLDWNLPNYPPAKDAAPIVRVEVPFLLPELLRPLLNTILPGRFD
jgi:serine/threonine protein kinase/WD40 repeat protein